MYKPSMQRRPTIFSNPFSFSPLSSSQYPSRMVISTLVTLIISISCVNSRPESEEFYFKFIPWGGRCRIPQQGEPIAPQETCDESNGIICQKYSQGMYCGCPIEATHLSFDKATGQCRRKPGELCVHVNTTSNAHTYAKWPANIKCHENAECVRRLVTSEGTSSKRTTKEVDKCYCRLGYVTSSDGLDCKSINRSSSLYSNTSSGKVFCVWNLIVLLTVSKVLWN